MVNQIKLQLLFISGKLCDRVGSPCTSDPCSNDGVCEEDNGKFKCTCKPGYTGNTCEVKEHCF